MTPTTAAADDERALRALALAYAHHADRGEPELVAELFEPDATLRMVWRSDEVPAAVSRGRRQIASAVGRLRQFASTFHLVANHTVTVAGNEGSGEVYCIAHHLFTDDGERKLMVAHLRYGDTFAKIGTAWLFAERNLYVDWTETRPSHP